MAEQPSPRRQGPAGRRRPSVGPQEGKRAGGPACDWGQLVQRVEQVAAELAALVADLPPGAPTPREAKALRRAAGAVNEPLGAIKKSGMPG